MPNSSFLLYPPAVYAVGEEYEIIFITAEAGAAFVTVGSKRYSDNVGGVVRSASRVHRVYVPISELDTAKYYTVTLSLIPDRHAYFPETTESFCQGFEFCRLPENGDIRIYMLADTHSFVDEPSAVAGFFGACPDLLILGGDNGNTASNEESILTMAKIAAKVTGGHAPVIYMRGNHDTRGRFAERLPEYVGTDRGDFYYSFRIGRLWGVVLDAGEDKEDSHEEYGDIADYTDFRNRQTKFLKGINKKACSEYEADGVSVRLALCHVPFGVFNTPFSEVFDEWMTELNKMRLHLMLSGHMHGLKYIEAESRTFGEVLPNYPVAVGSRINKKDISTYAGTALTIGKDTLKIQYTDINMNVLEEHMIEL